MDLKWTEVKNDCIGESQKQFHRPADHSPACSRQRGLSSSTNRVCLRATKIWILVPDRD
jgi:hypothetical protein